MLIFSMLPFSSKKFFLLFAVIIATGLVVGKYFSRYISLRNYLLAVTILYITFFFPEPLHAFIFVAYCYTIYYVFNYLLKPNVKLLGCALLVLPMVLIKISVKDMGFISLAGLSYITFRVVQIYFDNNRNYSPRPVSPFDFFLFMLFPPTILIGPIDRFNRFKSDLDSGFGKIDGEKITKALNDFALGVMQKFILAEFVGRMWLSKINPASTHLSDMVNMMYAYSVYLYFDFAGYSNMAVGMGKMLGIDVPFNFNHPYFSVNPQDFWRRWNATLGDWLRDYIFIPYYKWISGKKQLKKYPLFRQNSGLFLTFTLMGFWNGFEKPFIISGVLFGIYSVIHNTYVRTCQKKGKDVVFGNLSHQWVKVISVLIMFNFVCFALYIFSGNFPYIH